MIDLEKTYFVEYEPGINGSVKISGEMLSQLYWDFNEYKQALKEAKEIIEYQGIPDATDYYDWRKDWLNKFFGDPK